MIQSRYHPRDSSFIPPHPNPIPSSSHSYVIIDNRFSPFSSSFDPKHHTMAAVSSTFSNFLSFLFPTKPPPPPQQFNLPPPPPPPPSSSHTLKTKPSHTYSPTPPSSSSSCCSGDELSSVICPSLAYSNTLFFASPYGEEEEEATKRNSRTRRTLQKTLAQNMQDVPKTKKEKDEDNWDLPEEDFPY